MAHETGHIARRDPLVALLRRTGVNAFSTTFGVVDMSSLAGHLVGPSYSREIERLTDANSVACLRASGLRSDGLAEFFAAIDEQDCGANGVIALLSDHPRTIARETESRRSPLGDSALTAPQRTAVRTMCGTR